MGFKSLHLLKYLLQKAQTVGYSKLVYESDNN